MAAAKRSKKKTFDVTKAVKANARARVGQPKPERVLPDESKTEQRKRKYKPTLGKLLIEE